MTSKSPFARSPLRYFIKEGFVLTVIVLNTTALVLDGFPNIHARFGHWLHQFDIGCMVFYVIEVIGKVSIWGFAGYWRSHWNKFDFIVVLFGLPLFIDPFIEGGIEGVEVILLLRMGRFLRFFRMLRFIPNASQIWFGVMRSLKASVGIFLVLFVLNLIMAMGANILFNEQAPEHFGDPYVAFYSMFKVFTIEGWFEIPDELAKAGAEPWDLFLVRSYFAFAVIIGGVLGLSLANAVFVDEMTADNNDALERMVGDLRSEIEDFRQEIVDLQKEQSRRLEDMVSIAPPFRRCDVPRCDVPTGNDSSVYAV